MQISRNVDLTPYNSFHVKAYANYFASFTSQEELLRLLTAKTDGLPVMILGGGSNTLFTQDFNGWVLKNDIPGIEIVREDGDHVWLSAGAGVNWHQVVRYAVARNWGGLENLSLIPGNTGASPMQNIGAYGVEVKDVFEELEAFHLLEKQSRKFTNVDCRFGYRNSIFKQEYKGMFAILKVTFRLSKKAVLHTDYGAIREELKKMNVLEYSVKSISEAVIRIRQNKLPDPAKVGNAGSFFKNPVVSNRQFEALQKEFTTIPFYTIDSDRVKIPAAWLIEQTGFKGYRKGDAGCHERQPLVLINYGNASGAEIVALANQIREAVEKKFSIDLEREVNVK